MDLLEEDDLIVQRLNLPLQLDAVQRCLVHILSPTGSERCIFISTYCSDTHIVVQRRKHRYLSENNEVVLSVLSLPGFLLQSEENPGGKGRVSH